MKAFTTIAATAALLAATGTSAMLHITNPDYVVIITHEYAGSESNFGGGFGADMGGGAVGDNGAFVGVNTAPKTMSCTTGGDGICRMPDTIIVGNRWPGEVLYANDIVQGVQGGSFSSLSRSSDGGLWVLTPPDTPPVDPLKCVADICNTARKTQEDANANAMVAARAKWTIIKWGISTSAGVIVAFTPVKLIGGAITGSSSYVLLKEAGADSLQGLADSQTLAVNTAYAKCKTKCGA
jgi:hypothetical protein